MGIAIWKIRHQKQKNKDIKTESTLQSVDEQKYEIFLGATLQSLGKLQRLS